MDFKRVLFIGTGGGNDVFSTTLAMACLRHLGWQWKACDIAGILSPFHRHTVDFVDPRAAGIGRTLSTSRRFMMRRTEKPEIRFIDARVAGMVAAEQSEAERVFALSLEQGTRGLATTLRDLQLSYDFFVLVDVGGDILYRGKEDEHVLSPMFDAMVLRAFVDSGVPGILFEAGPGTDGELTPESLRQSLVEYGAQAHPIPSFIIDDWEQHYDAYIAAHRPGRTVPVTIQAYREQAPEIRMTYRARGHLGDTRLYGNFEQRIDTELCKQFFLIEPAKVNNPFAVSCRNALQWFTYTQQHQHHTNNEANLEYFVWLDRLHQFLTPSPLLSQDDRALLVTQGIDELDAGICDSVFFFWSDRALVYDHPRASRLQLATHISGLQCARLAP